eukprot:GHVP01035277.1.p1 GENE.GHVP01035277.1~~GHVP01035277.1.p1  ORF type:complete len:517 (-),score=101.51 GHVP01035277.1:439-1989(-)
MQNFVSPPKHQQETLLQAVDNFRPRFVPRYLVEKHNGLYPIPIEIIEAQTELGEDRNLTEIEDQPPGSLPALPNPYKQEIEEFVIRAKDFKDQNLFQIDEGSLELDENYNLISTEEEFEEMLVALGKSCIIGIDCEYHNSYSYFGYICLISIATEKECWIVDPFPFKRSKIHQLNQITSNPKIVKLIHGRTDILWLQHDFNCYFVNYIDTEKLMSVGGVPLSPSASHLAKLVYGVQLLNHSRADWRIRPVEGDKDFELWNEMKKYASQDAKILIGGYKQIRNVLLTLSDQDYELLTNPTPVTWKDEWLTKEDVDWENLEISICEAHEKRLNIFRNPKKPRPFVTHKGLNLMLKVLEDSSVDASAAYSDAPTNHKKCTTELLSGTKKKEDIKPETVIFAWKFSKFKEERLRRLDLTNHFWLPKSFQISLFKEFNFVIEENPKNFVEETLEYFKNKCRRGSVIGHDEARDKTEEILLEISKKSLEERKEEAIAIIKENNFLDLSQCLNFMPLPEMKPR